MCTELESLTCGDNELTQLDISNLTYLESLNCNDNYLTTLDVSSNPNLEYLKCYDNQLSSLDISNNPNLWLVFCDGNQISSLDFTNNPLLSFVSLTRNKISGQNMDAIITSLAQNDNPDAYNFDVIDYSEGDEENVCTKSQVAALKAKGWTPRYYNPPSKPRVGHLAIITKRKMNGSNTKAATSKTLKTPGRNNIALGFLVIFDCV